MARPRKPSAVHRRNGSYEKNPNRENKSEPIPKAERPLMPLTVSADEVATLAWEDVCRECEEMGIISTADRWVLELFALTYASMVRNLETVRRDGDQTFNAVGSLIRHPACVEANTQTVMINKLCAELGLSPTSRTRLSATKKEEVDPFLDYLKGVSESN